LQPDGCSLEVGTPFRTRVPVKLSGTPLLRAVTGAREGAAESGIDMEPLLSAHTMS